MSTADLPSPRILLGPGPLSVSPRVLLAQARPPIGYLDPELFAILLEIQGNLRTVFGTQNRFTLALTGTGMAGMESCFANLIEPGDNVVIGVHGFFGARMVELAGRYGADVTRVDAEWGRALDPEALLRAVDSASPVKLIACVHAETSTGVRQQLEPIADIARGSGALFLVDAVTSLGGLPVDADRIGIDACYSASQKCMGCPPGLAPITVSERALESAAARKTKVASWYYDWSLLDAYWSGDHLYHHTVPVNALFGLQESLRLIMEEGLEERFQRHRDVSDSLLEGLAAMGIEPLAASSDRLPTLNAVRIPAGVEDVVVRKRLLTDYGIEIGGGLGELRGRIWRIGTMGESATLRNVLTLVAALDEIVT